VVHEGTTLGSDGESVVEVSPCTSDQFTSNGNSFTDSLSAVEKADYVPKVKMRHKLNRRWTEVYTSCLNQTPISARYSKAVITSSGYKITT